MCGRFTIPDEELFLRSKGLNFRPKGLKARFNVAPSQLVPVLKQSAQEVQMLKWGLVPSWSRAPTVGNKMINARAETISEKPSFRSAFKKRRCVILANGFYEWKMDGSKKIPYYIFLKNHEPFGFGGLWEHWKSPEGEILETCTIITTEANEFMRPLHHRMPAIIQPTDFSKWLDQPEKEESLKELLRPFSSSAMETYAVSTFVNNPRNDSKECIRKAQ